MYHLYFEELESSKKLLHQYQKELHDALSGTGLCAGMSKRMCLNIANDLREHIDSLRTSIMALEESIKNKK